MISPEQIKLDTCFISALQGSTCKAADALGNPYVDGLCLTYYCNETKVKKVGIAENSLTALYFKEQCENGNYDEAQKEILGIVKEVLVQIDAD